MSIKPSHQLRVLTCCYCGARSTLGMRTSERLVCHGCGAPIRKIAAVQPALERKRKKGDHAKPAIPHHAEGKREHLDKDRPARRRKGKRKSKSRSVWYHISEALDDWDDVLDIFD